MRLRTTTWIIAVAVLLLGIVGLNLANSGFTSEKPGKNGEEAAAAARKAKNETPAAPLPLSPSGLPQAGPAFVSQLPPDLSIGPADAKHQIVFGWEWTPEVQGNPMPIYKTIEALRGSVKDHHLRIVNTDLVPDAPRGIVINGKLAAELPPDGILDPNAILAALKRALPFNDMVPFIRNMSRPER